ncbi:MAG TPA: histidine kinase [Thermoleophilaceae bacterium]|nr:histidine kinase [Thermoleophilaceae bacterium]
MDHPAIAMARVPRLPTRVDLLIAAALGAWALAEAVALSGPWSVTVRVAVALAYSVPLIWRRQAPLVGIVLMSAVALAQLALTDVPYEGGMPFPSLLVLSFSAGLYVRRLALSVLAPPIVAVTMVMLVELGYFPPSEDSNRFVDIAFAVLWIYGAWQVGRLIRRRALQLRAARAESDERALQAVADERARIARELHDVVAHSISIVSVQAGAADQLLEKDPARAREHVRAIQRTAQDTLREMRRLLDVLREDDAEYAPQPGLERLNELLDDARAAGLPVELREEGERGDVPPGVDLVAYRIVQEALTNVRKHAGRVPTTVGIRYGEDRIELEVVNAPGSTGNGGGAGHGLVGMRERTRVYGGSLEVGPDDAGGYAVRARLPLEART